MSRHTSPRLVLWLVAALVVVAAAMWAAPSFVQRNAAAAPRPVSPRGDLLPDEQATIALFEKVRGSVVFITTQTRVMDIWTRDVFDVPQGTGSGFVWDEAGHIVTNNHVVERATSARVRLADGREVEATRVGLSPAHDLAVLRISVDNLPPPIQIGSSHDLRVGQNTYAIGNPFGLDWTLTTGIVSALDRALPTERGRSLIEDLIQTDAAINPGNSGGPLLDSAGRLIGVNTAIVSTTGAYSGVGFAVPVDTVNRVVPQLIATGKYVRPTLGIEVNSQVNQMLTRQLGVKGVVVLRVTPGSGAAAAGLKGVREGPNGSVIPGDIIVEVDGEAVDGVPRLLSKLDAHQVGETVRLTVLREGSRQQVEVKLGGENQ